MFKELRIVELASSLAGPLTGSFFAELGAKVIKIENIKTGGDMTRKWKLPSEERSNSLSAYYCSANYGKEILMLDLSNENDYQEDLTHIREVDIVVVNFKPGTAQKLALNYQTIKKINRSIIYASLTGFENKDPRAAYDVVLQAETGFMYMNGEKGSKPLKMPLALIDVLAGHHLKEAILCALIHKMRTGDGKEIQISLYNSALASLVNQATNWLMAGHIPTQIGSQHPNIAPYGDMYLTRDNKYLVLAIGAESQFSRLAQLLKLDLESWDSNRKRVINRRNLNEIIKNHINKEIAVYWNETFKAHNIPFGIVKNMKEIFEDENAKACLLHENIEGQKTVRIKTAWI